jgi:hypothetical protein
MCYYDDGRFLQVDQSCDPVLEWEHKENRRLPLDACLEAILGMRWWCNDPDVAFIVWWRVEGDDVLSWVTLNPIPSWAGLGWLAVSYPYVSQMTSQNWTKGNRKPGSLIDDNLFTPLLTTFV